MYVKIIYVVKNKIRSEKIWQKKLYLETLKVG